MHRETTILTYRREDRQTDRRCIASVDLAKFFFAVCIVFLHGHGLRRLPYLEYYFVTRFLFRLAVPFFFVSSGYFLRLSLEKGKSIKTYCFRLLKPLIVFELLNTVMEEYASIESGISLPNAIFDAVRHILFYPYGAMWFLQACIIGSLLLYSFYRCKKMRIGLMIGVLLYGFALVCNNYYFLIADIPILQNVIIGYMNLFISARNGLFVGFLFLMLGYFAKDLQRCKKQILLVLMLALTAIYILEIAMTYGKEYLDDGALYLTHIALLPCMMALLLQIRVNINNQFSLLLRNLSTGIYMLHRLLFVVLEGLISSNFLNCLVVIGLAVIICLIVYRWKIEPLYSLLR